MTRIAHLIVLILTTLVMVSCVDDWRADVIARKELVVCVANNARAYGNELSYASRYWTGRFDERGIDFTVRVGQNACDTVLSVKSGDYLGYWNETRHKVHVSPVLSEKDPICRANVIAHELGHALGFEHDDEPGNVMHPSQYGFGLSEQTLSEMEMYR